MTDLPPFPAPAADPDPVLLPEHVPLVDLLDRVLARGVVVSGEIMLSIADVDLVRISLRALLSSVRPALDPWPGGDSNGHS